MAQPIRCDLPGHDHLADVLFSRTDGSVALGMCDAGFLDFAAQLLAASQAAQDGPSGPEASGHGSEAAPRPRGRSRRRSVPVPAVDVQEVAQLAGDDPDNPADGWHIHPELEPEPEPEPEPEREAVEA